MPKRYSIAEARNHLPAIVHDAENGAPIELTRRGKPVAVLISASEWASIEETLYLLRSPANAKRLLESIAELECGGGEDHDLIQP